MRSLPASITWLRRSNVAFTRDRYFWNISLQVAVVATFLGGFGPAQSLLQKNQGTSLTVAGLHGTAMGLASIVAGLFNTRIAHRYGREAAAWIGIIIFGVGALAIASFHSYLVTIPGVLVAATGVSLTINSMVTSLTHHFGTSGAKIAISQANAISALGMITGTTVVSLSAIAFGEDGPWKFGLLFAFPFAALLFFINRGMKKEHIPEESGHQRGKLSRLWWIAAIGMFAQISIEFCTNFWAAALIKDRVQASAAIGTACVIAMGLGMLIARWYGGAVMKKLSIDHQLYVLYAINALGFIGFWFSHNLFISILALFIIGVGISMQYSLKALRLILLSDKRPDLSQGVTSNIVGAAMAISPFALAAVGDHIGISKAYLMVPFFILLAAVIIKIVPTPEHRS